MLLSAPPAVGAPQRPRRPPDAPAGAGASEGVEVLRRAEGGRSGQDPSSCRSQDTTWLMTDTTLVNIIEYNSWNVLEQTNFFLITQDGGGVWLLVPNILYHIF